MKRKALKRCLGMTLSLVLSVSTVFSGVTPAYAEPVAEETESTLTEAEAEVTTDEAVSSTEDTEDVEDAAASNIAPAAEENGTDDKSAEVKSEKESAVTETEVRVEGSRENIDDATAATDDADESEETDEEDFGDEFSDEDLSAEGVEINFGSDDLFDSRSGIDANIYKLVKTLVGYYADHDGRSLFDEYDFTSKHNVTAKQILDGAKITVSDNSASKSEVDLSKYENKDITAYFVNTADIKKVDLSKESLGDWSDTIASFNGIGYLRQVEEFDLSGIKNATRVQNGEFYQCEAAKKIILPDTVSVVGSKGFSGCKALHEIQIKDAAGKVVSESEIADLSKVQSMGELAFNKCESLEKIKFYGDMNGATNVNIGPSAFSECKGLTELHLPISEGSNIGSGAFSNCTGLESVEFRDSLNSISASAFRGAGKVGMSIKVYGKSDEGLLPKEVTVIEGNAFEESGLKSVISQQGSKLNRIDSYAFKSSAIETFDATQFAELEKIDIQAFTGTILLKEVDFSKCGVAKKTFDLGEDVFWESGISKISLPAWQESIKGGTFLCAVFLNEVVLPTDTELKSIDYMAFYNCGSLENTDFLKDTKNLHKIGEFAFAMYDGDDSLLTSVINDHKKTIYVNSIRELNLYETFVNVGLKKVTIPYEEKDTDENGMELGKGCFRNNYYLTDVNLGEAETIKSIPEYAFSCQREMAAGNKVKSQLKTVVLPGKLTKIGDDAFHWCVNLQQVGAESYTVTFPESLRNIGKSAFSHCGYSYDKNNQDFLGYQKLILPSPNELITIEDNAFEFNTSLKEADLGKSVTEIPNNMFLCDACSKSKSEDAYKDYSQLERVTVDDKVTKIGSYAFFNNQSLLGLKGNNQVKDDVSYLPSELQSIGNFAFSNCFNLSKIRVMGKVETIGESAFSGCKRLEKKENVEEEEEEKGLEDVDLSYAIALKTVGRNAFKGDPISNSIVFNGNAPMEEVNTGIFAECHKLTYVDFAPQVKKVNERVFEDNPMLTHIGLPINAEISQKMIYAKGYPAALTIVFVANEITIPLGQSKSLEANALKSSDITGVKLKLSGADKTTSYEFSTEPSEWNQYNGANDDDANDFERYEREFINNDASGKWNCTAANVEKIQKDTSNEVVAHPIAASIDTASNKLSVYGLDNTIGKKYTYFLAVNGGKSLIINDKGDAYNITVSTELPFTVTENPVKEGGFDWQFDKNFQVYDEDAPNIYIPMSEDSTAKLTLKLNGEIEDAYISRDAQWKVENGSAVEVVKEGTNTTHDVSQIPSEATVELKPVNYGKANLTVSDGDSGKSSTAVVHVVNPIKTFGWKTDITGKQVNPAKVKLHIGKEAQITICDKTYVRDDGEESDKDEIYFESTDPEVATVDQVTGKIIAGTKVGIPTTIRMKSRATSTASYSPIQVEVVKDEDSIEISDLSRKSVNVGDSFDLNEFRIQTNSDEPDRWQIKENPNTCIELNGSTVKGLSQGKARVVAVYGDRETLSVDITVTDPAPAPAEDGGNALTAPNGLAVPVGSSETFTIYTKDTLPTSERDRGKRNLIVTTEEFTEELQYEFVDADGNTDEDSVSYNPTQNGTKHSITVTGKKEGTTNLLIKNSKGEQLALLPVTVYQPAENAPTATVTTQVDQVALSPTSKTVQLQAKADNNEPIVWWTSDPALATVDSNGLVTYKGEKAGDVVIYAGLAHNADKAEKFTIRVVKEPISTFRIVDKPIELAVGASFSIGATADAAAEKGLLRLPETSNETWTWSTSNAAIATVDEGNYGSVSIKGIAPGQVTVTATSKFGKKATYTFKVVSVATAIEGSDETQGYVGTTLALGSKIKVTPAGATETRVWTSSDEKVATVDAAGNVKLLSKGDVTISVKGNVSNVGKQWSIHVRVPSTKVVLKTTSAADTKLYMLAGNSYQLRYNISPDPQDPNGTEDKVTFKSSKKKVATVDENGLITAKKKGKAVITIKTESGKTDKITVNVVKKELASGKITVKTASVKKGKTVRLKLKLKKSKSTDTLTYAVNKPKLATIDEFGYLKALKKGTVKVTVTSSSGAKTTKKIKIK